MAKEVWEFKLSDKSHVVAINHHEPTGRAALWVNGKVMRTPKWFVDTGEFPFKLDHMPCAVRVHFTGVDYTYTLYINGVTLRELQQRIQQIRQIRATQHIKPAQSHLKRSRQSIATRADKASLYWLEDNALYEADAYGEQNSTSARRRTISEMSKDETYPTRTMMTNKQPAHEQPYRANTAPMFLENSKDCDDDTIYPAPQPLPKKSKNIFSRFFPL